ncbi:MAG TPA: PAS domain-containing sensor histidine kinase, partial [Catenuloplanes sp.]
YPWQPHPDSGDQLLERPDGSAMPVLTTTAAIPDRDGRPRAYVATYVDITERKRDEDALTARAAQVQQANDQLQATNRKLEEALAFKSDLMSMLSHEVSQPVSSIASLAELLTADWEDLPDDVRQELAEKIDKNTRRLIGMMNDLTLLFRLDAGKVTARRTPVPVREVIETVVLSLPHNTGEVAVTVDPELSALVDRGHLWHVVQNVLSNAVRFGTAPIEVRAWREQDRILLVIRDHGKGIPPDLLPDLFDRFTRGTGLGLYIARHLVEANAGTVSYEPAVPRGAQLTVTLEPAQMSVPGASSGTGDRG